MHYEKLNLMNGERIRAVHISHIEEGLIGIESYLDELETRYMSEVDTDEL